MRKNIFILALTDLQRVELETLKGIGDVAFHGLLDYQTLVEPEEIHFDELLDQCRQQLKAFPGTIDGIIPHWDFPTCMLAPMLCKEFNLVSPTLESVLKCEHKYWSRMEQEKAIPDCIPQFSSFDPFDDDALEQIKLDYPFWVKPVKSFASQLGFFIEDDDQFHEAMAKMRQGIRHIGDAFDEVLEHVDAPDAVKASTGSCCIAEEIITGIQSAPEGSVFNGEFKIHGVLDMLKDEAGKSFDRLIYPSILPQDVQQRMHNACEKFLKHVGFDNGCFNAEFMWDQATDKLRLIEVNTRISQSHSEMFIKVDGESNHKVAVDIALGFTPEMRRGEGEFAVAAKCQINYYGGDGVIARVPSKEEIAAIKRCFPCTEIELSAKVGVQLSKLPNQDAYSYHLGDIYLGAQSVDELQEKFASCLEDLHFEMEPVPIDHSPNAIAAGGQNADDHLIPV